MVKIMLLALLLLIPSDWFARIAPVSAGAIGSRSYEQLGVKLSSPDPCHCLVNVMN